MQKLRFIDWCEKNYLRYDVVLAFRATGYSIFSISGKNYLELDKDREILLHQQGWVLDGDLVEYSNFKSWICAELDFDYIVFQFGSNLYYSPPHLLEMNLLRDLGECSLKGSSGGALGIHGKSEVLMGMGGYDKWVKRSAFLKYEFLAICERNTLAGAFEFQNACKKAQMPYTFGYETELEQETLKFYAINETGWRNLMTIHYLVNVEANLSVDKLASYSDGINCVLNPIFNLTEAEGSLFERLNHIFGQRLFYQFTFREFKSKHYDEGRLKSLQLYLQSWSDKLEPVLIDDLYYPYRSDYEAWTLILDSSKRFTNQSGDLYLKHQSEIIEQFKDIDPNSKYCKILERAISNQNKFKSEYVEIKSSGPQIPTYIPSKEEQEIGDSYDIFVHYIMEGFKKLKNVDKKKYRERIEEELDVMVEGNLIDYFLILKDCYNFADKNGIFYNFGRGSAAGSLVLYLIGLTKIDPIKEGLIFARFLNKARIAGSVPDVDCDMESARRDEVKQYLLNKYTNLHTAYIGNKIAYKVTSAIGDIAKFIGLSQDTKNSITSPLPGGERELKNVTDFVNFCLKNDATRNWIEKYPRLFELLEPLLGSIKAQGIHAAGVALFPASQPNYLFSPLRKDKDGFIVTEWDGKELDKLSFLKNDILSVDQLDKIKAMIALIGKDIDIYSIPTDDAKTLSLFNEGLTEDIFQFNSHGMTDLLKQINVESIKDLDAAVALYRPGAMGTGGHISYANRKNGREPVEYIPGTENQTRDTYGILLYQEQLIFLAQEVGGFTLEEADLVRRATGKKDIKGMQELYPKFISGGIQRGHLKESLDRIWQVFIDSASYSFNKSHSVCYARLAYISMWFKANYPNQFYQVALEFVERRQNDREETKAAILREMKFFGIKSYPAHINFSGSDYSLVDGKMYASFSSIKMVGDSLIEKIIEERNLNGEYYSVKEFAERTKAPKNRIKNMILAGCFDDLIPSQIEKLVEIKPYLKDEQELEIFNSNKLNPAFWATKQAEVCGITNFDFSSQYKGKLQHLPRNWPEIKTSFGQTFICVGILSLLETFRTGTVKAYLMNQVIEYPVLVSIKNASQVIKNLPAYKNKPIGLEVSVLYDKEKKSNWLYFSGNKIIELI